MPTTDTNLLRDAWVQVATSGGGVLGNPQHFNLVWRYDVTTPTGIRGNLLEPRKNTRVTLPSGENLYVKAEHDDGRVIYSSE